MKKETILLFSLVIIIITSSCSLEKVLTKGIEKQIINNASFEYLNDQKSITVMTVGTGSPLPGDRAQTGTAIFVNGYFFLFDIGAGVVQKCENLGLSLNTLDGVFITHYHSDHMIDLPNVINRSWLLGRDHDLSIYGPEGLKQLVQSANQLLTIENGYRLAHHGAEIMDTTKAKGIPIETFTNENPIQIVFQKDGIKITMFEVDHEPIEPSVGYAIEYAGKKVIISGDTKENETLKEMAKNADLLVHEVMLMSFQETLSNALLKNNDLRNSKIIKDIMDYHTGTEDVVALANASNAKKLVLNHLAPFPNNRLIKRMYLQELKNFKGQFYLADDGDVFIVQ